jgi:hypothetical protein
MAQTPETSEHTSIKERIYPQFTTALAFHDVNGAPLSPDNFCYTLKPRLNFEGNLLTQAQTEIPFHFKDYLSLVD